MKYIICSLILLFIINVSYSNNLNKSRLSNGLYFNYGEFSSNNPKLDLSKVKIDFKKLSKDEVIVNSVSIETESGLQKIPLQRIYALVIENKSFIQVHIGKELITVGKHKNKIKKGLFSRLNFKGVYAYFQFKDRSTGLAISYKKLFDTKSGLVIDLNEKNVLNLAQKKPVVFHKIKSFLDKGASVVSVIDYLNDVHLISESRKLYSL